jgi:hypothetical protein
MSMNKVILLGARSGNTPPPADSADNYGTENNPPKDLDDKIPF